MLQQLATVDQPKPSPVKDQSAKPLKVRGRLKQALDLMVWGNGEQRYLTDSQAAVITRLNVLSIRNALQKPHVLAYYKQQREVLRSRECAANIHRLAEIRDAADNMPAVNAIKLLEELGNDQRSGQPGVSASAGVTIQIVQQITPAPSDQRHSEPERRTLEITKG